jgi:methenyltetrahydrofolate cyclohydrolase
MAAADPNPSGGAAAAHVAALAASVAAAAADRSRERWEEAGGACAQAQALRRRAIELAEREQGAYAVAREALAQRGRPRPAGSPREHQQARDWRLRVAVEEAAAPPLELAASAADIALLAGVRAAQCSDEVRADAVIAAELAAAAASAAARLVQINLVTGGETQFAVAARGYAETAAAAAASASAAAIDL